MSPETFLKTLNYSEDETSLLTIMARDPVRAKDLPLFKSLDEKRQSSIVLNGMQYALLLKNAEGGNQISEKQIMDELASASGSTVGSIISHGKAVEEGKLQLAAAKEAEDKKAREASIALKAMADSYTPVKSPAKTAFPLLKMRSKTATSSLSKPNSLFAIPSSVTTSKTSWTMDSIHTVMTDVSQLTADLSDFEYEGLDVNYLIQKLAGIAELNGRSMEQFRDDMELLVGMVVMRGTNMDKIMGKTNKAGAGKFKALCDLYGVETNTSKRSAGKDKVILGRFPACFPIVAANMLAIGKVRPIHDEGDLPNYLRFMGGASLIPLTDEKLFDEYLAFAKEFDIIINGANSADEKKTGKFADIVWRSNLYNHKQRVEFCEMFSKM
jgi:hypothetical protein